MTNQTNLNEQCMKEPQSVLLQLIPGFNQSLQTGKHSVSIAEPISGVFVSEPGAVYEIQLVAFNGNGESDCSKRLVSLAEQSLSEQMTGEHCGTVTFTGTS